MESKFIKFFIILAFLLLNAENIDGGKGKHEKQQQGIESPKENSTSPFKKDTSLDYKDEDSLNIMEKGLKRLNLCPKQIEDEDGNASKIQKKTETINAKTSGTKNGENTGENDHHESVKMMAKKLKRINLRLKQADHGNENVSKRKEKSATMNTEISEKQNKRKNPGPDRHELPNIITNGLKQLNLENTGENDRPIIKQNKRRRIDRNEAVNIGAKGIKILYG